MHTEKITSIKHVVPEPVYNISVAVDESYTANGVVVHNCRSRIVPYFGTIPGERDFTNDFSQEFIDDAEQMEDRFQLKYWKL